MAYDTIIVETRGKVGLLTLNRPQALNALNSTVLGEVLAALGAFDADPNIGCIVVTGSERAFAAGADIKEMQLKQFADAFMEDFFSGWEGISRIRKPIIAAVAGYALGGGCELAMMCDFIIAGDNAKFGQPEITLGVMPGMGGSQRLTRLVGKSKAMDMCLTGRMMDAAEAERGRPGVAGGADRRPVGRNAQDRRQDRGLLAAGGDDGQGIGQSRQRNDAQRGAALRAAAVPFDVRARGPEGRNDSLRRQAPRQLPQPLSGREVPARRAQSR